MKLTFLWEKLNDVFYPVCTSKNVDKDGVNIICCLLMDDGGIPYIQSLPWLREGIVGVDSVLNREVASSSWNRESWGALITIEQVKIYSLFDEAYFENFTIKQFKCALCAWKIFLESQPDLGEQKNIEL